MVEVLHQAEGNDWVAYNGDSAEVLRGLPDNSVHYSVFSPPFASLYTYSNSERDMGNCRTHDEFYEHMRFMVAELLRVTKPGRLLSFHCMQLPSSKSRDGFIGIVDFRGLLIKLFQDAGWIFHSEVVIWKDPVVAVQRTKALGLLYKQLCKDSAMSRMGIPDYVVTMRKPGVNEEPVNNGTGVKWSEYIGEQGPSKNEEPRQYAINVWQRYASPVWFDIDQSNTLQKESAREDKDERHICPLQLDVIRRCIQLWTNPGDVVLSPFLGIGSEGYVALQEGRKFIGIELKRSYFDQAVANLASVEPGGRNQQLRLIG